MPRNLIGENWNVERDLEHGASSLRYVAHVLLREKIGHMEPTQLEELADWLDEVREEMFPSGKVE